MTLIETLLTAFFYLAGLYLLTNVLYLLFFALAGHWPRQSDSEVVRSFRRICVLIPAYKEDAVIIETGLHAVNHAYEGKFEVFVIADSLRKDTIQTLHHNGVGVIEVTFEKSTKGKALLTALETLPSDAYDIAVVLDADNLMGNDFLHRVNAAFEGGYQVVQGHRTAKNLDTPFALLDACNEEINNHIFRQGHAAVGMSSALIGSGMAFGFGYLKNLLLGIGETAGEDKEIDFRILKDRVKIAYLPQACVYDEKIADSRVFTKQRTRWVATQVEFLKKYFVEGLRLLLRGNVEFFDKVVQTLLLPRILLMGVLSAFAAVSLKSAYGPPVSFWWSLLLAAGGTLLLSLPKRFYNRNLWQALLRLPSALFGMSLALLSIRKANRSFLHTPHGAKTSHPLSK